MSHDPGGAGQQVNMTWHNWTHEPFTVLRSCGTFQCRSSDQEPACSHSAVHKRKKLHEEEGQIGEVADHMTGVCVCVFS